METDIPICDLCKQSNGGEQDWVKCCKCGTTFHKNCIKVNDSMVTWECLKCYKSSGNGLQVPPAPRSNRSKSRTHRSQATTSSSQNMDLELKKLEEERQALQRSIDEKALIDKAFIQKKYDILQSSGNRSGASIKSQKSTTAKTVAEPDNIGNPEASGNNKPQATAIFQNDDTPKPSIMIDLTTELQRLEEERHAQQKVIHEKTLVEQEFIRKKYEVLQNKGSRGGSVGSQRSLTSKEKVESWMAKNSNELSSTKIKNNQDTDCNSIHPKNPNKKSQEDEIIPGSTVPVTQKLNSGALLSSTTKQTVQIKEAVTDASHLDNVTFTVPNPTATQVTQNLSGTLSQSAIAARHIVSRDLPVFSGNTREWPRFISAFNSSTQLCEIQDSENAMRLEKCLKGKAFAVVEKMLYLPGCIPNVISTLTELFGKPEFLINDMLEDLRRSSKPKNDDIPAFIEFALQIENLCATMKAASLSEHLWNPVLLQELVDFLPMNIKCEWASYKYGRTINLEVFGMWIKEKSKMLIGVLSHAPFQNLPKIKGNVNIHSEGTKDSCIVCHQKCSKVEKCPTFIKMSYSEKWKTVKELSLCRTCLINHLGRKCRIEKRCGVGDCVFRHHSMLHKVEEEPADKSDGVVIEENMNVHYNTTEGTLFKILPVTVSCNNKSIKTFAMLDDGCSLTLVHQSIADGLGISGKKQPLCLRWTANMRREELNSMEVCFDISGTNGKKFNLKNVRTVEKLNLPVQSISAIELQRKFSHLNGIPLASYLNGEPKILIGLTHANLLVNSKIKSGQDNEPLAAKSKLGWTVFGSQSFKEAPVFHMCDCKMEADSMLDASVKRLFELEQLGTRQSDATLSQDEKRAMKQLEMNTVFKGNFYETGLLWKFNKVKVPSSYNMALKRWSCLESKCKREPELRSIIQDQMENYLSKGYVRKLSEEEFNSSEGWYLPIFAVRNPNKPSKVRIVWDAAAEVKGISLNSLLLKGPDNLASLPAILRRFREGKYAVTGDIKDMFHQVRIREKDQQFQKFLWSSSPCEKPDVYVMRVMTFGASCSPAIAQFVKNLNAEKYIDEFPLAVYSIINNHYVDDYLESTDSEDEAVSLSKTVKLIHSRGGFHIRNWISNSRSIHDRLEEVTNDDGKNLELSPPIEFEKILGLWWNTSNDCFTYSLKLNKANTDCLHGKVTPSKRDILRAVMSVFDPLGFLSHFLIFPRILLQDIWRCGLDWDNKVNAEQYACWKEWVSALPSIESLNIPRWLGTSKKATVELYTFVDASEEAYAAAVYVRYVTDEGIKCSLISAKSRVSPLKPVSIPRLELLAATIGVRLAKTVNEDLGLQINRSTFWSDSRTVLSWIQSDARKYKQFVGFRIAEILDKSMPSDWRWVPTSQNVADMATRKRVFNVVYDSEWFQGPSFLYNEEKTWPTLSVAASTMEEIRPKHCVHLLFHDELKVDRFSDFRRLRRTQAFVLRFINNLKVMCEFPTDRPLETGPITKAEYKEAQNTLFRKAQAEGFPDEVACFLLPQPQKLHKGSPIFKDAPFLDENGVLRASTRLAYDEMTPYEVKFPVLLPRKHPISELIMIFYHRKYHHINKETIINEIAQRYVITRLRTTLKKVTEKCQWCKNRKAVSCTPIMSALPRARTSSFGRPFTYVGVDLFGPLYVTVRRSQVKRWGVLFTCLSIRAIHIEITSSLSADSFILSLDCFVSRRGMPSEIYCDNGTNFRGASKELRSELKNLDFRAVQDKYNSDTLEFIFNPPAAPHMGGAWERLVRSIKTTLNAVAPTRTPTDDLLKSLMAQVENMINSRPLTYIPIATENEEPLTPNHFLLGSSSGLKPLGIGNENSWLHRKNWLKSQEYADRLWIRWRKEYLPSIRRRTKWFTNQKDLAVGDIVLLLDDNIPRNLWPKAKVLAVSTSRDGKVRSATIQTSKGIYDRPAVKLAILDVRDNSGTSPDTSIYGGGVLRE